MSQCHNVIQRKNANLRRLAFLVTVLLAFYCCDLFAELYLSVLYIQTLGGTLAQLATLHVVVAVGAVAVDGVDGFDGGRWIVSVVIVALEAASREVLYVFIYACLDVVIRMSEWLYISFAKVRISEEIAKEKSLFL
jgi:hypothetical protein